MIACTIFVQIRRFRQVTRNRTLPAIVTSRDALRDVSFGLVRTVFPPAKGIRLVGETLSSFERRDSTSSKQLKLGLGMP
jgi:DNA polymerase-4